MESPIDETIAELTSSDQPVANAQLVDLSNLTADEVELFEQAWSGIEPERRREIMYKLVEMAEDNAKLDFDSIFKVLLNDADAEIRMKAIEGLFECEDTSLITSLINILEQDESDRVQAAAAIALGKFALLIELEKLHPTYKSKIEPVLLSITNDESRPVEVRRRALEAVAPLSLPEVKKAIKKAYESDEPRLKVSAVYAMGRNCDPLWLPILLKELGSPDAEMRYEASGACGELGEMEAVPSLIELINDPDAEVQLAAIQALGKIGGSEAKEALEECLSSTNETVSEAAEEALSELEADEDPFSFKHETGLS